MATQTQDTKRVTVTNSKENVVMKTIITDGKLGWTSLSVRNSYRNTLSDYINFKDISALENLLYVLNKQLIELKEVYSEDIT